MTERVIVFGGAGFIGTHLVECLDNSEQFDPIVADITQSNSVGVNHERCDITVEEQVRETLEIVQPDTIIHLASNASVGHSVTFPTDTVTDIVSKVTNICNANKLTDSRVINVSTCHVYGDATNRPSSENDPTNPDSPYGAAKLAAEEIANHYYQRGMNIVNLRYSTTYGPGMPQHMLFDDIIEDCTFGGPINLKGTGENTRDFTHVQDIVQGTIQVILTHGISGNTFNIASGHAISTKRAAQLIRGCYDLECEINFEGRTWDGDTRHIRPDISKAISVLGYEPQYRIEDGLEEYINE